MESGLNAHAMQVLKQGEQLRDTTKEAVFLILAWIERVASEVNRDRVPMLLLENVALSKDRSDEALSKLAQYHPFVIKTDAKCVSPVIRCRWFFTNIPPSWVRPEANPPYTECSVLCVL